MSAKLNLTLSIALLLPLQLSAQQSPPPGEGVTTYPAPTWATEPPPAYPGTPPNNQGETPPDGFGYLKDGIFYPLESFYGTQPQAYNAPGYGYPPYPEGYAYPPTYPQQQAYERQGYPQHPGYSQFETAPPAYYPEGYPAQPAAAGWPAEQINPGNEYRPVERTDVPGTQQAGAPAMPDGQPAIFRPWNQTGE